MPGRRRALSAATMQRFKPVESAAEFGGGADGGVPVRRAPCTGSPARILNPPCPGLGRVRQRVRVDPDFVRISRDLI